MILGISGSPIKDGNNEQAIAFALDVAEKRGLKTEIFSLAKNKIGPCIACNACKKEYTCTQKDDMQKLIPLLEKAKAIIISSPVYFGSVSGQVKCLLDRTLQLRRNKFVLKDKIGAAIAIGGSRNGGQELTIQQTHAAMHINGMIVVGDNNHFGGTAVVPFESDETGKETVRATAEKICDLLEKINFIE